MEKNTLVIASTLIISLALLLSSVPALAGSVSYEYDALGRLERVVYDDGTAVEFVYDAAGNRTSRVVTPGT